MQSEHPTPSPAVPPGAVAVTATNVAMTPDIATTRDGDPGANERWRAWSARGAKNDRDRARTINRVFAAVALALLAWLVFQWLS